MNNQAFSLIELMVVIAILAILATAAVPAYKTYRDKVITERAFDILLKAHKNAVQNYISTGKWTFTGNVGYYAGSIYWGEIPSYGDNINYIGTVEGSTPREIGMAFHDRNGKYAYIFGGYAQLYTSEDDGVFEFTCSRLAGDCKYFPKWCGGC